MELNISHLLSENTWNYVGSVATHGQSCAKNTFDASCHDATSLLRHLVDPDTVRGYLANMDTDWSTLADDEAYAVLLQDIVLHLRDAGLEECTIESLRDDATFWEAYARRADAGEIMGNFFMHNGDLYFTMV